MNTSGSIITERKKKKKKHWTQVNLIKSVHECKVTFQTSHSNKEKIFAMNRIKQNQGMDGF